MGGHQPASGPAPSAAVAVDGPPLSLRRLSYRYELLVILGPEHVLQVFECRSAEQTSCSRRYVCRSVGARTTRVFVVTEAGDTGVVAYYAWCMAHIATETATPRARKGPAGIPSRAPS
jgi:hypothetical protein